MKVRRPLIQLDARGRVATHGPQNPARGVWHDTESHDHAGIRDLEGVVSFWEEQNLGYGAHVIIDADGNSAYCADPRKTVWAVENRNTGTVSIELIGFASYMPKLWLAHHAQLDKLARWMAWLRLEHNVPLNFNINRGWSGHADQTKAFGGSHTDPGKGFPKRYVLSKARVYYMKGWS